MVPLRQRWSTSLGRWIRPRRATDFGPGTELAGCSCRGAPSTRAPRTARGNGGTHRATTWTPPGGSRVANTSRRAKDHPAPVELRMTNASGTHIRTTSARPRLSPDSVRLPVRYGWLLGTSATSSPRRPGRIEVRLIAASRQLGFGGSVRCSPASASSGGGTMRDITSGGDG